MGDTLPPNDSTTTRRAEARVTPLVDTLCELGLPTEEARAYVHVALHGPVTAADTADSLRLPRAHIYRVLESLVQCGYAHSTVTRPARYQAVPLDVLLNDLKAQLQVRMNLVNAREKRLREGFTVARRTDLEPSESASYAIHRGREDVMRRMTQMMASTKDCVDLLLIHPAALRIADHYGHLRLWEELVERGLEVRLILAREPADPARLARLPSSLEVRALATPHRLDLTVADDQECLFLLQSDASPHAGAEGSVGFWTNAPSFVWAQRVLFDQMWASATPLKRLP